MNNISGWQSLAAILCLLALVACGGGGGGGGGVGSTPPVAKAWGTAQLIETDNAGDAGAPQVAVDAAGNVIAVWWQSDGTNINILSSRYTAASGWGTPVEIDNVANSAGSSAIAMDAAGNAVAVWYQYGGAGALNIYANRYDASLGAWGTAELIENAVGDARDPQVAVNAAGNAVAVWKQFINAAYRIRAAHYTYDPATGTGQWGTPVEIDSVAGDVRDARIAVDTSGNAVAVWSQLDVTTLEYTIWANSYAPGSGWFGASRVSGGMGNAMDPQIAMDAAGNVTAVWKQYVGSRFTIMASRLGSGTGISIDDNTGIYSSGSPQIAVDASGNVTAVWGQDDGTRDNIWSNRYDATHGIWGTAVLIETDDNDTYGGPDVAVDAAGNAIAVWLQLDSAGSYNIRTNRYTPGQGWGTAQLVALGSLYDVGSPQIAVNAAGDAAVVWEQFDSSGGCYGSGCYNTWANTYR